MTEFLMPKLGADMSAGKLVKWCKRPGEPIHRGETIAVIETDKANIDVEAFASGVMEKILVEPSDEWLPVGTALAIIYSEGEIVAAPAEAPVTAPPSIAPSQPAPPSAMVSPTGTEQRVRISPAARKLAEELNIDPTTLTGTGPGGRITLEDVQAVAKTGAAKPAPAAADRQARMRQAIAAAMARSKREIPHYYLAHTIDMEPALNWLSQTNAQRPITQRLLHGVLLIKACALALREAPELNGFWLDGVAKPSTAIHIGVAISLRGGGLVAPALLHADQQNLDQLMRNFQDLVQRARSGSLRSSEYSEPTITLTNLGERGVETVFGVIFPPQVALVGFGTVVERPWLVGGQVVARHTVTATLSADHRASDGHRGGLLLAAIDRLLQQPEAL